MKKCSACGNTSKDEVMQCPFCGCNNFVPENYQSMPQAVPGYGQQVQQPMMQQNPQMGVQQPMGQQMPGYGQPMGPMPQQPMAGQQASQEKGNIAWGILGFFIPIVGWILYFVWKNSKPADAKVAGIGGIIGFCVNFLIAIL